MFTIDNRVVLTLNGKLIKGVVKDTNEQQSKVTYWDYSNGNKQRKTTWFDNKNLELFNEEKHKKVFSKQADKRNQRTEAPDSNKMERKLDVVLFAKVKPNATIPTKRYEDGCYDIYACFEQEEIVLPPHVIVDVPTGIASAFSPKYRFDTSRERGSTGKFGIEVRSGQIDSGYRGEWFLKLTNVTEDTIIISKKVADTKVEVVNDIKTIYYPYTKAICQAALERVPNVETKEIPYTELEKIPSQRGKGKLGDSGK